MNKLGIALLFSGILFSCGQQKGAVPADEPAGKADSVLSDTTGAGTPVTVAGVSHDPLDEYIELNAVSAFLQKSYVKANANGYLQSADVYPGKFVESGQPLFTLKTKEAQSIGNSIRVLDSTLKFSGVSTIRASQHGYITQLSHQSGDYVQDGEQLAVISDRNSFVFLLDLPYELRRYVLNQGTVQLILPDGEQLNGKVGSFLPTMDSASQTQSVVIRVNTQQSIPENLIARVRVLKTSRNSAQSLPRGALLTDETESEFWVMKLTGSAGKPVAVKVPVTKGIETKDRVEILSPVFAPSDRILISGNYGLPDSARVDPGTDSTRR